MQARLKSIPRRPERGIFDCAPLPPPPSAPPLHENCRTHAAPIPGLSLSQKAAALRFPSHLFRFMTIFCAFASTNGRTLHLAAFRLRDNHTRPRAPFDFCMDAPLSCRLRGQAGVTPASPATRIVGVFDMSRFFKGMPFPCSPYAACCYAIFFKGVFPAITGRLISGEWEHGSRQRLGL